MSNVKDILAVLRFCALGILLFAPVASHALPACDDHFALRLPDTALGGTAEAQVAPPPPRASILPDTAWRPSHCLMGTCECYHSSCQDDYGSECKRKCDVDFPCIMCSQQPTSSNCTACLGNRNTCKAGC